MQYTDYKVLMEKEYKRNRKCIFTCYFFLAISIVFFALFFLSIRELAVIGAAFLLDAAAGVYAFRAFKGIHPYWEMQLALKAKTDPSDVTVYRFAAGVEYALEQGFPIFKGRSLEIFGETLAILRECTTICPESMEQLERVLKRLALPEMDE